jgi:hypothetical protein
MPAKPHIKMRISLPATLHEKICAYRFQARHETRAEALTALVVAGLAAMAKPVTLPKDKGSDSDPLSKPARSKRLVPYAGRDSSEQRRGEWRSP